MNNQKPNWYNKLLDNVADFAEQFALDEVQTTKFRDFVLGIAKDQFKAGNRSGAGWAFEQARKKIAQGQPV